MKCKSKTPPKLPKLNKLRWLCTTSAIAIARATAK